MICEKSNPKGLLFFFSTASGIVFSLTILSNLVSDRILDVE